MSSSGAVDFGSHVFKDLSNHHSKAVLHLRWSGDGSYLSSASNDKTVKLTQVDTTGVAKVAQTISYIANQVAWHPQDQRFLLSGDDKSMEVWDVRHSRASMKLTSMGGNIYSSWSPCGHYVAVGNKNDTVAVYDIRTEKQIAKKHFEYEVNEFAWTEESKYLLFATGGGNAGAVDIVSFSPDCGEEDKKDDGLAIVDSISAHFSYCVQLKVDPTFRRMAVGSLDRTVSLWSVEDMICHNTFSFDSEVNGLSFSGDGQYVAAISNDPYVLIVNSDSGDCQARVNNRYKCNAVAWHPKYNMLAIASDDKTIVPNLLRLVSFPSSTTI